MQYETTETVFYTSLSGIVSSLRIWIFLVRRYPLYRELVTIRYIMIPSLIWFLVSVMSLIRRRFRVLIIFFMTAS